MVVMAFLVQNPRYVVPDLRDKVFSLETFDLFKSPDDCGIREATDAIIVAEILSCIFEAINCPFV